MEKRDRVRVPIIAKGKTTMLDSVDGGMVYTANISPHGLCFYSQTPLDLGMNLSLELDLEHPEGNGQKERLHGRIRWRKDLGEMIGYGFSFSSPLNQDETPQLRQRAIGFQTSTRLKRSPSASASHSKSLLTKRERQIIQLIALGQRNREMAERLRITRKTVETHRANIYTKLKVHNVVQLLRTLEKTDSWNG